VEVTLGDDRDEAQQVGGLGERGGYGADDRAKAFALAQRGQAIVGPGSDDEAEHDRGDPRGRSRTEPDGQACQDPDQEGQRLGQRGVLDELKRRHVPRHAEHGGQLGEEDQDRDGVLEARHDGRGDISDQVAEAQDPEQGLEDSGKEDDEKDQNERLATGGLSQPPGDDGGEQEGHHAARGIHQRVAVAEEQDGEREEDGAVEAGEDADGDILVAER
jgi:hypothetical protein